VREEQILAKKKRERRTDSVSERRRGSVMQRQ
jgi:hypothetical protein